MGKDVGQHLASDASEKSGIEVKRGVGVKLDLLRPQRSQGRKNHVRVA